MAAEEGRGVEEMWKSSAAAGVKGFLVTVVFGETTVSVVRNAQNLHDRYELGSVEGALVAHLHAVCRARGSAHGHQTIVLEAPVHSNETVLLPAATKGHVDGCRCG